jgi:signal transduction histidine kinase
MRLPSLLVALACALNSSSAQSAAPTEAVLTTTAAVRALSREDAGRGLPVRIEAVVTYHEPAWYLSFVQDSTGGIYVSASDARMKHGDRVVVSGVTAPGGINRIVTGTGGAGATIQVIGRGPLPAPKPAQHSELSALTHDAQWISIQADVRSVQRVNDRALLELSVGGKDRFRAVIPGYSGNRQLPSYLRAMPVTVSGVLGSMISDKGEFLFSALLTPSEDQILIDPQYLERRFQSPPSKAAAFYENANRVERSAQLHFRGLVVFVRRGEGFFMALQEEQGWGPTVWVQTTSRVQLAEGQMVNVIGTPEVNARKPQLRSALVKPGEMHERWTHRRIAASDIKPDTHWQLITTEGTLVDHRRSLSEDYLVLSFPGGVLCARLDIDPRVGALPEMIDGSRIRVSGICVDRSPQAEDAPPFSFEVWVSDHGGVEVVSLPPWWTPQRIAWGAAAVGLLSVLAFGWAVSLRKKVRQQTEIIRTQLQRETRHEERTRIAREFHDTLEQHFAGIGMQLDAIAATVKSGSSDADEMVRIAREMARHSREEARHVIWELRAPTTGIGHIETTLERKLRPIATQAGLEFRMETFGTPVALSAQIENHLLRIAQEAVTNTIKHAAATAVSLQLAYTVDEISLSISDDGCGLPEMAHSGVQAGFGLCGMRERVDRLNGTLEVEGAPGRGVTVVVRFPLVPAFSRS